MGLSSQDRAFYIQKHQAKGDAFEQALLSHGWRTGVSQLETQVAFFDVDLGHWARLISRLSEEGIKCFLIPHAARPSIFHLWKTEGPSPFITAEFVPASGHIPVLRASGKKHPIEVVGWYLSEIKPFTPVGRIQKVLYAPMHPNHNGYLHKVDLETNAKGLRRLLEAQKELNFHLTIRHLFSLKENGLDVEPGNMIKIVQGKPDNSTKDILEADVVVSTQTFGYLSVAMGKPTLFMDENIPPKGGDNDENFGFIRDWDKIKDHIMFPLDFNDEKYGAAQLLVDACRPNPAVIEWRERMIGEPFSPSKFVDIVESYLVK